jgi:hypothetical protein
VKCAATRTTEFAKIVEKMQRGKQLKKKEFAKIHWFIWEKGRQ